MTSKSTRLLSILLVLMMIVSIAPMSAFAVDPTPYSLTIASRQSHQLAPGVKETEVVSYDSNGDRVKYWYNEVDVVNCDTVEIKANYHDNDNTGNWGKATVVEQADAATAKRGYNVVASQNAAYYNVSTGQPTGAFVMEGVNVNGDSMGNSYEFFARMDDGTYMIGKKGTFSQYSEHVTEAIAGHLLLVWDGAVVPNLDAVNKYPRSTIGVTAEGNVITMLADGNQKPASAGLTYAEQAQLMLELGCVAAIELDGGGSATYASKYEGEDSLSVRNNCCDGTVRSVSNTFMIISTAVADGTFDHANLSTEYAYYAANSSAVIEASGADLGGHAAEIPEDVSWALSDDSFGTIENGVFTSNGKTGTVAAQMLYNGNVVGSVDITVVHPTDISFAASEKTIPYGKTADLSVSAMYNGAVVYAPADLFDVSLSDAAGGTMDGFMFTACSDESVAGVQISAQYKYSDLAPAVVTIHFGKGSDVLFDFEDGDISKWGEYHDLVAAAEAGEYTGGYVTQYVADGSYASSNQVIEGIHENVFLATEENGGKVHSGNYSLGYTFDYRQNVEYCNWLYGYLYYWGEPIVLRDVENGINGTRIGMWVYIPEEAVGSCSRLAYTYKTASGTMDTAYLYFTYQYVKKGFSKLTSDKIPESGWAYVYVDLDDISSTYVSTSEFGYRQKNPTQADYAPAFIQWIISSSATGAEKCTFYIDDITLDYSSAVDDRDAPEITNVTYADSSMADAAALNGNTTAFSTVSFAASVAEGTLDPNPSGVNGSSAKVYVDGHEVKASYASGKIATTVTLPNGTHDITFAIEDNQGNLAKLTKQIVVANPDSTYPSVTVDGQALAEGKLKCGGQYNILINTDRVEEIDTVTTTIWLNSASKWALEHMDVLYGFDAEYTIDELACMATIKLTRTDAVEATGAATLATIPVYNYAYDGSTGYDAHTQWTSKNTAPILTLSYKVQNGTVTYVSDNVADKADYVNGFSNTRQDIKTELDSSIANLKNTIGEWHYHTEAAVADKAATCTEPGYTGRTVCSDCNSILNWGEVIPATGHTFEVIDGVLQCKDCGKTFTGVWTDGKEYYNGALPSDGWNGDYYYVDGKKLTGIQCIDGVYYSFDDSGVSQGKYTGLIEEEDGLYYAILGELQTGWIVDGEDYYYFDKTTKKAVDGEQKIGTKINTYKFVNCILVEGYFEKNSNGIQYMWAGKPMGAGWLTVGENTYYINRSRCVVTGKHYIEESDYSGNGKYYMFDENGVLLGAMNGIYEEDGGLYYYNDGARVKAGLVKEGNDYYYFGMKYSALKEGTYYLPEEMMNELLPAGNYVFKDYKLQIKNGIVEEGGNLYYYQNNEKVKAGLVDTGDGYYYFSMKYNALKDGTYYLPADMLHGIIPAGNYTFKDYKLQIKNGIVEENGSLYYYQNNEKVKAGLVKEGNDYYYFSMKYNALKDGTYYLPAEMLHGIIPAGNYTFKDYKLQIKNGIVEENGNLYYYQNNEKVKAGLVEADNGYYYFSMKYTALKDGTYYLPAEMLHGILPEGNYTFANYLLVLN